MSEPAEVQVTDEVASFAQRAFARAIDFLAIAVVLLPIIGPASRSDGDDVSVPFWAQLLSLLVWLVYETVFVAWLGGTMGKMALRCKVVDRKTGARPSVASALVRAAVVPGLATVVNLFSLIVYATAVLDADERRGLIDRLAGTAVVRAPSLSAVRQP